MRCITLKQPWVTVWMKAMLDVARASPLFGRQFYFQEHQGSDENDKSLLVGKLVAPRPDKYVGLDLI